MDREGGRDRGFYFGLGERRPRRGSGSVVTGHHTQQSQTNKQDAALDAVEMFISFQMKSSAPYVLDIQLQPVCLMSLQKSLAGYSVTQCVNSDGISSPPDWVHKVSLQSMMPC